MSDMEQMDLIEVSEVQTDHLCALVAELRLLRYDLRTVHGGRLSDAEQREYRLFKQAADEHAAWMTESFAETEAEIQAGMN